MSFSVKLNDVVLVLVLYESNGDRLEFFIGVRFDSKKLLKRFDFSQKSDTNLTLINKGGIVLAFKISFSLLKIAQYLFAAVF